MSINDFDFSGKRVRFEGNCLTKFDLGQILEELCPLSGWWFNYNVLTYSELVVCLKAYLHDKDNTCEVINCQCGKRNKSLT